VSIALLLGTGSAHPLVQYASSRKEEPLSNGARWSANKPKSKGSLNAQLSDRELLLVAILALWRADAAVYFLGTGDLDAPQHTSAIGIVVWDEDNEPPVKAALGRSLLFLLDTSFLMRPGDPFIEHVTKLLPKMWYVRLLLPVHVLTDLNMLVLGTSSPRVATSSTLVQTSKPRRYGLQL
jgi:hypothetical protein